MNAKWIEEAEHKAKKQLLDAFKKQEDRVWDAINQTNAIEKLHEPITMQGFYKLISSNGR